MKSLCIFFSAFVLLTSFSLLKNVWTEDDMHRPLEFTVTNLDISDVTGVFDVFDLNLTSSKRDFSDAMFELSPKINPIVSRVEARDARDKSGDFFDAAKFPEMYFQSTSVKKTGKYKYKLTGDLSLHGIKRQVTMDLLGNF